MKKRLFILMFALAIFLIVGAFGFPKDYAMADSSATTLSSEEISSEYIRQSSLIMETKDSYNYDLSFCAEFNGKKFRYDLLSNTKDMTSAELEDCRVYYGRMGKMERIEEITSLGIGRIEAFCYVFCGLKSALESIDSEVFLPASNATMTFNANNYETPFEFVSEQCGRQTDIESLLTLLIDNVGSDIKFRIPTLMIEPKVTQKQLRASVTLRSAFATEFLSSGSCRAHNISLALSKVNGKVLRPRDTFSFNQTVGERSVNNGFMTAKIISDGKYINGVGGGVCQASTTIYNCALLGGLQIIKASQHSLVPSYVEPSFDAMVNSSSSDLKFVNNTLSNIYIVTSSKGKRARVKIYGEYTPYLIERISVSERVPCSVDRKVDTNGKYPQLVYEDDILVLRNGSDGVKSTGYLNYYLEGQLVKQIKIRTNTYKSVSRIEVSGAQKRNSTKSD
ncbi:MAG: VanW family protein [Clostridia bacterium]